MGICKLEAGSANVSAGMPKNFNDSSIHDDIEHLEFLQYHQAFSKCWEELPLGKFDRKNTLLLIDQARDYRNSVMHFRSMESDSEGLQRARELLRLLS